MKLLEKWKISYQVLLLAIVAALVGAICQVIFVDLFYATGSEPSDAFRGGFWGALLAFIFVQVSQVLGRFSQVRRNNLRALGDIQFRLNEAMNIANDDLFVIEQWDRFYKNLQQAPVTRVIPIFTNRVEPIPGVKDHLGNLTSIGLVNELFVLESDIRKLNDSLYTWQRSYEIARSGFVDKKIDFDTYLANVRQQDVHAQLLKKFVTAFMADVVHATAATRLLLRDKPFMAKLYNWLNPDKHRAKGHPDRVAEVATLRSEVEQGAAESRARIDAITGGSQEAGKVK